MRVGAAESIVDALEKEIILVWGAPRVYLVLGPKI
jgi:hypothetical protein